MSSLVEKFDSIEDEVEAFLRESETVSEAIEDHEKKEEEEKREEELEHVSPSLPPVTVEVSVRLDEHEVLAGAADEGERNSSEDKGQQKSKPKKRQPAKKKAVHPVFKSSKGSSDEVQGTQGGDQEFGYERCSDNLVWRVGAIENEVERFLEVDSWNTTQGLVGEEEKMACERAEEGGEDSKENVSISQSFASSIGGINPIPSPAPSNRSSKSSTQIMSERMSEFLLNKSTSSLPGVAKKVPSKIVPKKKAPGGKAKTMTYTRDEAKKIVSSRAKKLETVEKRLSEIRSAIDLRADNKAEIENNEKIVKEMGDHEELMKKLEEETKGFTPRPSAKTEQKISALKSENELLKECLNNGDFSNIMKHIQSVKRK